MAGDNERLGPNRRLVTIACHSGGVESADESLSGEDHMAKVVETAKSYLERVRENDLDAAFEFVTASEQASPAAREEFTSAETPVFEDFEVSDKVVFTPDGARVQVVLHTTEHGRLPVDQLLCWDKESKRWSIYLGLDLPVEEEFTIEGRMPEGGETPQEQGNPE